MAGSDAAISTLSGGNQQKVVLAREIGREPGVLIAFQPTWGLDPARRASSSTRSGAARTLAAPFSTSRRARGSARLGDRVGVIVRKVASSAIIGPRRCRCRPSGAADGRKRTRPRTLTRRGRRMSVAAIVSQRAAWRDTLAWRRRVLSVSGRSSSPASLILMAGKNPFVADQHIVLGRLRQLGRASVVGLNKAAPYMLAGAGSRSAFAARSPTWARKARSRWADLPQPVVALIGAAALGTSRAAGLADRGYARRRRMGGDRRRHQSRRGVHEVLVTLMMNFIAWLMVAEFLQDLLGEIDAGFPQTPMFENAAWLPKLGRADGPAYRHRDRDTACDRGACLCSGAP